MKRMQFVLGILALATPSILLAADVDDGCAEVLRYSSRDYSIEKSDIGVAVKVYDQYCENDSIKSGVNFNVGLDAVIKAVPIKFSLGSGSAEERVKYFCKTFDSVYKRNEQYYRSTSQVVNQTTNAWLGCKTLASQGVVFRPQMSKTQILIEIVRKSDPVTVLGIEYDQNLATCNVPNTNTSKIPVLANKNTVKDLDYPWTITCVRTPQSTSNEQIYPSFDISVTTTKGPFLMPVAADAKFPYQWASEFQQQLASVINQAKITSEGLNKVGMQSGSIALSAIGTRPITDGSQCPNNSDATRGIRNGRVTFATPFESVPNVSIALNQVDIGDPSIRLSVNVTSIDKNGFNFNFVTWCNTKVYGASASWIAVAK